MKLQLIIKYLIYLLALTPLVVSPMTIFPFNFGRAIVIQVIIEIAFILYLILAIYNKQYRPAKNVITIILASFVFILFISSLFGMDFNKSFWSSEERFTGWLFLLHMFFLYIVSLSILRQKKDWIGFFKINIAVAFIVLVIAMSSLLDVRFWGINLGYRIAGFFGNPLFLGTYLIFILMFSLFLFVNTKIVWKKIGWLMIAGFIFYGIILTLSRSILLGFLVGSAFAVIYFLFFYKNKKIILSLFIIFLLLVGFVFIFRNNNFIKKSHFFNVLFNINLSSTTSNTRLIGWGVALGAIVERPILGWGMENFFIAFNKEYNPSILKYSYYETWFDKPHNKLLEVAVDSGITGLILYLSLFGASFYIICKKRKIGELSLAEASVLSGGLSAYFAQNLFVFDTPSSYLIFFLTLAFITSFNKKQENNQLVKINFVILPIGFLLLLPILWFINISPFYANVKLRQNTTLFDISQKINVDGYKKSMQIFNPYKEEWRVDFSRAVLADLRGNWNSYTSEEIFFAIEEIKKNITEHPNNAYYYLLLGGLYAELGPRDASYFILAETEFDKAWELSPNRQHILINKGRMYGLMGESSKMVEVFNEVIALEPEASVAYWEGAKQLLLFDKYNPKVVEWLRIAVEKKYSPQDDQEFLVLFAYTYDYFLDKKDYSILVNFYERMEQIQPEEAGWFAKRATANYFLKKYELAIEDIKKAIALDESYKKEGEEFLIIINSELNQ